MRELTELCTVYQSTVNQPIVAVFKGVTGRWQMDHPPPSPLVQIMSPWVPTAWRLSSITVAAETGSSHLAMPPQSSPSQVTHLIISDPT